MQNQAYAFIVFILNGFLIGLLFDIFRIFRKSFKTPDFITYLEDFIFWIITGLLLLYSIFKFNNGELWTNEESLNVVKAVHSGSCMRHIEFLVFVNSCVKERKITIIQTKLYDYFRTVVSNI